MYYYDVLNADQLPVYQILDKTMYSKNWLLVSAFKILLQHYFFEPVIKPYRHVRQGNFTEGTIRMTIHYPETLTIKTHLFVPNTVLATHTPPETCQVQSTVTHSIGNSITRQFNTQVHPMDTTHSELHFPLNTTMSQLHFPLDTILSQLNLHWVHTIMSWIFHWIK
jgi:hypothetical protein